MPNDAKLGLVAGVAVVVLIAALFFRRDAQADPALPPVPLPRAVAPRPPAADHDLPPPPTHPDLPPTGAG